LRIEADTYTKVRRIMGFNSRYTQNSLGEMNLLDAARGQLDKH